MSTLSVQMADLLPVMNEQQLELRATATRRQWRVSVRGMSMVCPLWEQDFEELWQGLDAALAWIWREYGQPQEEAK